MRVLVACERSGAVRRAFEAKGHYALSCDLEPADDDGEHYQGDVLDILGDGWDMMIAHPECTYLCNSGVCHLYIDRKKENGLYPPRWEKMEAAAEFFVRILKADIKKIVVENPIMHGHAKSLIGVNQSHIIQPWQHGHKEMKATCLWLQGVPKLQPTNIVGPPPKDKEERKSWERLHRMGPGPERSRLRSQTYPGIADAFAEQWG